MKQNIFKKIIFSGSIIFLLFLSVSHLKAQDSIPAFKKNEIWVNFFSPGVDYKRAMNKNTYLRIGLNFSLNLGKSDYQNYREYSDNSDNRKNVEGYGSLNLGIEKRKKLSENVTLFYGPEIFYRYTNMKHNQYYYHNSYSNGTLVNTYISQNTATDIYNSGGVGFSLGAMYHFNNFFGLGVNWSPKIYYTFSEHKVKHESNYLSGGYTNSEESSNRKDNDFGLSLSTPAVKVLIRF